MPARGASNLPLREGLYEHLVTEQLERALASAAPLQAAYVKLDDADAHLALARHVSREIERVLDALPSEQRAARARDLAVTLVDHLATVDGSPPPLLRDQERRQLTMLDAQLHHRGVVRTADATIAYFAARPSIAGELDQLAGVFEDRVELAEQTRPVAAWTLALHRHYSRREIAVGVGYVEAGDKNLSLQGGILQLEATQRELLFVTLDKSGKQFSDHALSRLRDQSGAVSLGDSGQRQRVAAHWQALRAELDQRLVVLPVRADGS